MEKEEIQNLIKELIEKTTVKLNTISIINDGPKNIWVSAEVGEPHFFISREGEGLQALSYLANRIIEAKDTTLRPPLNKGLGRGLDCC